MEKGDKVVILPRQLLARDNEGIVEKVDEGFIWVNGRPYMRCQLDYADDDDTEIEVMRMFAHLGGRTLNGK